MKRKVFISYAHEGDMSQRVKGLVDWLRQASSGLEVITDHPYENKPPSKGWTAWMQHSVEDSDVVLIVCTERYKNLFEKREVPAGGFGVSWESTFITDDLYFSRGNNGKFYPILPDGGEHEHVPVALRNWHNNHRIPSGYERILKLILPDATQGNPATTNTNSAEPAANPFKPWLPATPPNFLGQEKILRNLRTALEEKRSVSVLGDWRIGKTSLLKTWQQQVEKTGRKVVLVSGEGPERVSCAALVTAITGKPLSEQESADSCATALNNWAHMISPPPLVLIDEADHLLAHFPVAFFERLRGMVGNGRLCLVLATRQDLDKIYEQTGHTSPFVNLLQQQRLGLLDSNAAEQIIALGQIHFSDSERSLLRTQAGRHPYYLTLLAWHLWDNPQDQAQALLNFSAEAGSRLRDLWRCLSTKEQNALKQVSGGQNSGAKSLLLRGLIYLDGTQERVFGQVLSEWIQENQ